MLCKTELLARSLYLSRADRVFSISGTGNGKLTIEGDGSNIRIKTPIRL